MRISVKGKYAIKLLVDIAEHSDGEYISLTEISKRQNISKKYLEQIVPMLLKTGILRANRGHRGGYKLNKSACSCSIGEVLRATEGELFPPDDNVGLSDFRTQFIWDGLYNTVKDYIDGVSVQDILEQEEQVFVYSI